MEIKAGAGDKAQQTYSGEIIIRQRHCDISLLLVYPTIFLYLTSLTALSSACTTSALVLSLTASLLPLLCFLLLNQHLPYMLSRMLSREIPALFG